MLKMKLFCPIALSTIALGGVCFPLMSCKNEGQANIYNVHVIGSKNVAVTVTQNQKGKNLKANIDVAAGYSLRKLTVTSGMTKLVENEDYQFVGNRLEVKASAIDEDVTIEVIDNEEPAVDPYNVAIVGCQSIVVTIVENKKGSDLLMTLDVASPHYLTNIIIKADDVLLSPTDFSYTVGTGLLRIYAHSIANANKIIVKPIDEQAPSAELYNVYISGGSSYSSVCVVQNIKGQDLIVDVSVPTDLDASVTDWQIVVGSTTLAETDYSVSASGSQYVTTHELTVPADLLVDADDIYISFIVAIPQPKEWVPVYYEMTSNCEDYATTVNEEGKNIRLSIDIYDINVFNGITVCGFDEDGDLIRNLVEGIDFTVQIQMKSSGLARAHVIVSINYQSLSDVDYLGVSDTIKSFPRYWDYGASNYESQYPQATTYVPYTEPSLYFTYYIRCRDSGMAIFCDDVLTYENRYYEEVLPDGDIMQVYVDPSETSVQDWMNHRLNVSFTMLHLRYDSDYEEYAFYERVNFDIKVQYDIYENDSFSEMPFNWIVAPVFYYIYSFTEGTETDKIQAVYSYLKNDSPDWSLSGEYSYIYLGGEITTYTLLPYTKATVDEFFTDTESILALQWISDFMVFGSHFLENLNPV